MAKFGVGDTVVGNEDNCHGVTGEDCVITVTSIGPKTFSGVIDEHPDDDDYVGEIHNGLRYEWFDLEESASDIVEEADWDRNPAPKKAAPRALPKAHFEMAYVTVRAGMHHDFTTRRYEGERARILTYDFNDGNQWYVTLMFDDMEMATARESEIMAYSAPKKAPVTMREEDGPKDVKVWGRTREEIIVTPAHKAPAPIKAPSPLGRLDTTGTELTSGRRTRRAKVEVQPEYRLKV